MITIYPWSETSEEKKKQIMQRAMFDLGEIESYVRGWMERVRQEGDAAIVDYVRQFDRPAFELNELRVRPEEIQAAYDRVEPIVIEKIRKQIAISRRVAEARLRPPMEMNEFIPGVRTGYKINPIEAVGLTVPAGQVPLPTVMQILGVNAKAAGVPRIVACYPPTGDYPEMLIAADLAGVDEIYRVGGIVGIAALTYGTETIAPVHKIFGPGSIYTQAAKLLAFGRVNIDMVAGPSEAVILADVTASPRYCAADILARAEHAPDAAGVLITDSPALAKATRAEVTRQFGLLKRQSVIEKSLAQYSAIIVVQDWQEAIRLTNEYSPEHLEIISADPRADLEQIRHAGAIFLGPYAPVAVGDYASGTCHILPTGHFAKMASPATVESFQKISEVQELTRAGLESIADVVDVISDVEGLDAHWNSVNQRLGFQTRILDAVRSNRS